MKHPKLTILIFALIFFSCDQKNEKTLFTLVKNSQVNFTNSLTETKAFNVFNYRNFYDGGGVAIGDLNNDGLPDLFFTANQGANKLYLNKGQLQFEDISEKAGFKEKKQWSTGVVLADINGDGWLDIYVCNAGSMFDSTLRRNQLFINNHDLTFTESAAKYGLDNTGYTTQVSFFDYDLDGDLDCFMVNNSPIPVNTLNYENLRDVSLDQVNVPDFLKGGGDHLYKNDNGHFTEVSKEAGIHGGLISLGLGVAVADVNNDGYPDVYVSNDFYERDYLYINQKNGTFKDELENSLGHTSHATMGADIQDINNDGSPDIFTTDMLPDDDYRLKTNSTFDSYEISDLKKQKGFYNQFTQNALQVNNGSGKFMETAFYSGVSASDWSWGALMFDADNDGKTDLYVCNGILHDETDQDFINFFSDQVIQQMVISGKKEEVNSIINKIPSNPLLNKAFKNEGNLHFRDVGKQWGFTTPSFSNGAAYGDLDNDGDLDLVINNVNEPAMIYRNNSREQNKNNFIAFRLKYSSPNNFAIGSTIKVYSGNQVQSREIIPSRGFQSSMDYKQIFGLAKSVIDSVTILWPDRSLTTIIKPAINQLHLIDYSTSVKKTQSISAPPETLFEKLSNPFEKHAEDDHVDFYFEKNIPFMLSRQGPKAAAGDVNGDQLTDIYIGGARDQPGQLYLQTKTGFIRKEIPDFKTFDFDDVTVAFFFDCDGDGDLDLFTGGGGNFAPESSASFQNQLFINDGKGNFTLKRGAFPIINANCGAAVAFDYDGDGYPDLFVGNRSVPQNYGVSPHSYVLHNDGQGKFTDVTSSIIPGLRSVGMVSSAAMADVNGDGKNDLIIAGEWMYPHIFSFNGKSFVELKTGLENLSGWWQSMAVADVDGDGDTDIVLGNLGENFYLRADSAHPVKLWIKDFDNNGKTDKILTHSVNGNDMPVFVKKDLADQIPSLKTPTLTNHQYAGKTIQELFPGGSEKAQTKQVNYTASCVAYNDGKGHFSIKKLPVSVQLSSVNAIVLKDLNQDGYPDIIAGGNFFDILPQFGRLDASAGNILLNDKKGNFVTVPEKNTGIYVPGQTRDIISFKYKNEDCILFLENNDYPVMYQLK